MDNEIMERKQNFVIQYDIKEKVASKSGGFLLSLVMEGDKCQWTFKKTTRFIGANNVKTLCNNKFEKLFIFGILVLSCRGSST